MSKYRFKRKYAQPTEAVKNNGDKIMNADASPEENTTVFSKADVQENGVDNVDNNDFFIPVYEEKRKKHHKRNKPGLLSGLLAKAKSYDDDDYGIFTSTPTVEDLQPIEETPVELPEQTDTSKDTPVKTPVAETKQEVESETSDATDESETDTYEGLEETAIEEDLPYDEETAEEPDETDTVEELSDEDKDEYDEQPGSIYDVEGRTERHRPRKNRPQKSAKATKEYTSAEQKEDFLSDYRKKTKRSLFLFLGAFVAALILIYLETKTLPHPNWLLPGKFGVVYLMVDLQLVFLAGACVFYPLVNGAKALFTWKPNRHSVTFISFAVSVLQIILHSAFNIYSKEISLYSSVFGVCAAVTALIGFLDYRREYATFRIATHEGSKMTVSSLDKTSAEYSCFKDYLDEDATLYKRSCVDFVDGFCKMSKEPSPYNDTYKISIPLVFVASLVFAVLTFTLSADATVSGTVNNFTRAFMLAMPLSSIFMVALPFFASSVRLYKSKSAIIGEADIERYANASLVSFSDTDIFNHRGIRIASIKTSGKSRIDNTYLLTAKVLKLVGGPLDEVFNKSVIPTSGDNEDNKIISVAENGISAFIDEQYITLGTKGFMSESGFEPVVDAEDGRFTATNGRILYVAINGEISAKFYIKYAIGSNFKKLLDSFLDSGVCITVNTKDPNIDTDFVLNVLGSKDYPVVVVKDTSLPTDGVSNAVAGGIVSCSGIHSILRSFLTAEKLSRLISINTLAKYVSLIFAFILIAVAFLVDGSHDKITPVFVILYQLIWSLPIIGTSIFG